MKVSIHAHKVNYSFNTKHWHICSASKIFVKFVQKKEIVYFTPIFPEYYFIFEDL